MHYKALMIDVDGTTVPYNYQALPSEAVTEAIKKAQQKVIVCLVTGRSYGFIEEILNKLQLINGFAVVNNGSQVINLASQSLIYDRPIQIEDAQKIINILREENISFYLKQEVFGLNYKRGYFTDYKNITTPYMFFTDEAFSSEKIDYVLKRLSFIPTITIYKVHLKDPTKFGLNIMHVNATKMHGIQAVINELQISPDSCIGVGDSYNDFPLLMACGLKIAMGNAIKDLKDIADYIAPSVDEDGLVDVIEKYILIDYSYILG